MKLRTFLSAVILALLAALAPGMAAASSITIEGNVLVVRTDPGKPNAVRISGPNSGSDAVWWIRDVAGDREAEWPNLPPACDNLAESGQIQCDKQGGGIRVETGDGNDVVSIDGESGPREEPVHVLAGDGIDRINGRANATARDVLDAGPGDDTLNGGDSPEALHGGAGNDTLNGNGGNDEVRGEDGDDKLSGDAYGPQAPDLIDGGPGMDKMQNEWVLRTATPPISVTLDGAADDGRPGEGDNVVGVEDLYSSSAATFVAGNDPVIFKVFNSGQAGSTLVGGPGNDALASFDWNDTIRGNAGDDRIEGGYGDDTIDPGPGRDTVAADAVEGCNFLQCRQPQGNDTVMARDGEVDSIDCGVGADRVVADAADVVAESCETVDRGVPVGPAPPKGGGKKGGAGKGCVVPKVRRGAKLASVRKALTKAGCRVTVRRVRSSKVRKGRVVGLSRKQGTKLRTVKAKTRLKTNTTIVVRVSRGR